MSKPFAKRVYNLRVVMYISQADLARLLEVDARTVSRWETGHSEPTEKSVVLRRFEALEDSAYGTRRKSTRA